MGSCRWFMVSPIAWVFFINNINNTAVFVSGVGVCLEPRLIFTSMTQQGHELYE